MINSERVITLNNFCSIFCFSLEYSFYDDDINDDIKDGYLQGQRKLI